MQKRPELPSAPALERGLYILEILQDSGPLTLETLSDRCKIPKSSLLRLLETLQNRGYVTRHKDKRFANQVTLTVQTPQQKRREEKIQFALERLSEDLGFTTEWYTVQKESLLLSQRVESQDGAVQIRARIGFQRRWWEELDAVARIGHAVLKLKADKRHLQNCTYYKNGILNPHNASSYKKAVDETDLRAPVYDAEYNSNGIRRMAQGIFTDDGALLGILAVPMHFQPDADSRLSERIQKLQEISQQLQLQLQEPL